jgi:hypothetical protein
MLGDQAERQLNEAASDQRDGDEQADLGVAEVQIGADQRKRRALCPIDELVNELDSQCDSERRGCITASAAASAAGDGGDRSTSHVAMLTARRPPVTPTRRAGRRLAAQCPPPAQAGTHGSRITCPLGSP